LITDRTVIISFLGTSDYTVCNYCFDNLKVERVAYVQIALAEFFINSGSDDKIILMLTETARKANWDNEEKETLKDLLRKHDLLAQTEIVDIPEGKSETEIWSLFEIMFNSLQENDEIILDITHSFRSIPLLSVVLANYAGFVKNVKLRKICYGAFESLGHIHHVKTLPIEARNVPVYDLGSFNVLQRWSFAAGTFTKHGIISVLTDLLREELQQSEIYEESFRKKLEQLANQLEVLEKVLKTVRAKAIYILANYKRFEALFPILLRIKDNLVCFKAKSIGNCFRATEWYIDNGMIQQGFTLLQESIIAYFIHIHDKDKRVEDEKLITLLRLSLKYVKNQDKDQLFRSIMNRLKKTEYIKMKDGLEENECKEFLSAILNDFRLFKVRGLYNKIKSVRDDINHGGSFRNCDKNYEKKLIDFHQESIFILKTD